MNLNTAHFNHWLKAWSSEWKRSETFLDGNYSLNPTLIPWMTEKQISLLPVNLLNQILKLLNEKEENMYSVIQWGTNVGLLLFIQTLITWTRQEWISDSDTDQLNQERIEFLTLNPKFRWIGGGDIWMLDLNDSLNQTLNWWMRVEWILA